MDLDSTISRLMLTVKDRAKPVVERATRIVEHKSRYRGWGGGVVGKRRLVRKTNTTCENYTAGHSQTDTSLFHLGVEKKDDILL